MVMRRPAGAVPALICWAICWATAAHGAPPAPASDPFAERIFIVQLAEPPALTYRGRPGGLAATRPLDGEKFDPQAAHVRQYSKALLDEHDQVLRSVGAYDNKLYSYRYTFNGFAARLTGIQAQKLRSRKDVLNVWEDGVRYLYTNDSPVFLGLYDATAGLVSALDLKGEDVVIGVIDSGIAPEHPSFNDTIEAERPRLCRSTWAETSLLGLWLCQRFKNRDDQLVYQPPTGWNGSCEVGEHFTTTDCNNKIIGARFYADGFLDTYAMDSNEFMSARDADGHGTHIASTAAGGEVRATLAGNELDRIVGIAPRARIAVYKACWLEPGQVRGSCTTSDLQRAIEDAVADGVDIINYSVGNTDIGITDPDDLALLAAANAGVLSVVAAGNDGPYGATILSPSGAPWVLTVGASSRAGDTFEEAVRIDGPADVAGDFVAKEASFTPPLRDNGPVTGPLVLVDDDDTTGGTTYDACSAPVNADALIDKVALLQRGGPTSCTFEVKIRNAQNAGAIAAVVFNNSSEIIVMAGTRNAVDIPAVMIGQNIGERLLTALQNGDAVDVTLDKNLILSVPETGNVLADFSSRGPNLTAPDIIKPDVTAPGVHILAGQTPDVANGIRDEWFQYLSGTSMSTPQVAGLAALIREAHPDWSPAAIKSALMTTGRQDIVREDGITPADPFDIGAGHVVPNLAVEPGLVYDAGKEDYEAFLCGLDEGVITDEACADLAAAGFPDAVTDLNMPSIAVSALVADKTIRRRVTNVGTAGQYTAQIVPPPGIDVTVDPTVLSLAPGETAPFDVTLTTATADLNEWQFGSLSWVSPEHTVRSPIAAFPVLFDAPLEARGSGVAGNFTFDVRFGYTGAYTATTRGLAAPFILPGLFVTDDPTNGYAFEPDRDLLPTSIWRPANPIIVAATDTLLRVALFNDKTAGDDDLDLYVYRCPGLVLCEIAGISGAFDSNEQVDIVLPLPGEYIIDVHGFETAGSSTTFDLYVWTVGPGDTLGNLTVTAPTEAVSGQPGGVTVAWDGLETYRDGLQLKAHLGTIMHDDAADPDDDRPLEVTVIEIRH